MNKKGDETPWGIIISFGVLIIAAIFIIYWFYSSGTTIFDKTKILDADLILAAKTCEYSASQGDKTSYCVAPMKMKVAGKEGYFNCPYIKNTLNADIPSAGSITCANGYDTAEIWRSYYCGLLKNAGTDTSKVWVNGDKCGVVLTKEKLQALCGTTPLILETESCAGSSTKKWTQQDDDGKKYSCCVSLSKKCSELGGKWIDSTDSNFGICAQGSSQLSPADVSDRPSDKYLCCKQ